MRRFESPVTVFTLAILCTSLVVQFGTFAEQARSENYAKIPLGQLAWSDAVPTSGSPHNDSMKRYLLETVLEPRIHVDRDCHAFVAGQISFNRPQLFSALNIVVQWTDGVNNELTGVVYLPSKGWDKVERFPFRVADLKKFKTTPTDYYKSYQRYCKIQANRRGPGASWFRHQALKMDIAMGKQVGGPVPLSDLSTTQTEWDNLSGVFTGSRAIGANLQLDRQLNLQQAGGESTVPLDQVKGVTVPEINWANRVKDITPTLDPLARMIPADQHVVFMPDYETMKRVFAAGLRIGAPAFFSATLLSEDAGVPQRYETQLCPIDAGRIFSRDWGISSVALTGSDSYLAMGSDVAVLFQSDSAGAIEENLKKMYTRMNRRGQVERRDIKMGPYTVSSIRNISRSISSYCVRIGNVVIVSNSPVQLRRVIETSRGQRQSLHKLPEYRFFRHRYPRGDASESAFLIMTDAAIRRWCSPRFRIGNSRRVRAAAVMQELQLRNFNTLLQQTVTSSVLKNAWSVPGLGQITLTEYGIEAAGYGNLNFMTPIIELKMDQVHPREVKGYQFWRRYYERLWRRSFDPIAVQVKLSADQIATDVTVIPLALDNSSFPFPRVTQGGSILPSAGERHQALLHMIASVGPLFSSFVGFDNIEMYVDDDEVWEQIATADNPDKVIDDVELPIAFRFSGKEKPAQQILEYLRGLVDIEDENRQTLQYQDHDYYAFQAPSWFDFGGAKNRSLYVTAVGGGVVVSASRRVLQSAIDRSLEKINEPKMPWLGQSANLQVSPELFSTVHKVATVFHRSVAFRRNQGNINMLNQWKRLLPDHDPIEVHRRLLGTTLLCPAGGSYRWNDDWKTMESSRLKHAGEIEQVKEVPSIFGNIREANLGFTLDGEELRARAVLKLDQ